MVARSPGWPRDAWLLAKRGEQMRAVEDAAAAAAGRRLSTHEERGLRLAELILSRLREDGSAPGARLPTERQLSVDLGVTRSSIRHALAILEAQGRISREVGRGTFLRDRPVAVPDGQGGPGGSGASGGASGGQARPLAPVRAGRRRTSRQPM